MIGIRWGVIASVTAFIISLMLGLIAGNQAGRTFLTALVFGLLFFGIGFSCRMLVNNFFPELLFIDNSEDTDVSFEQEEEKPGMVMQNTGDYAVPEMYRIPGKEHELGNIEDLIAGTFSPYPENKGIDSKEEEVYNDTGVSGLAELEDSQESDSSQDEPQPVFTPGFTPSFGDDEGLGGLPDLDAFTLAFSGGPGISSLGEPRGISEGAGVSDSSGFIPDPGPSTVLQTAEPDRSQYKGNKPQELEGDFDAKEIAQGLRTLLKKDQ